MKKAPKAALAGLQYKYQSWESVGVADGNSLLRPAIRLPESPVCYISEQVRLSTAARR
jgi:hypothetical protein